MSCFITPEVHYDPSRPYVRALCDAVPNLDRLAELKKIAIQYG